MRLRRWVRKLWHRAKRGRSDEETDDAPTDSPTDIGIVTHDVIVRYIRSFVTWAKSEGSWPWEIHILFLSGTDHLSESSYNRGLEWKAILTVKTENLRTFMKRGIHLRMEPCEVRGINVSRVLRDRANSYSRSLRLLIKMRWRIMDPHPHSKEYMYVKMSARGIKEAREFDPRQLSASNAVAAVAFDPKGEMVYRFSEVDPQDNFNALYGDEPMEGLWPWPRATEDRAASL